MLIASTSLFSHSQSPVFREEQLRLLDVRYKNYRIGNGLETYLYDDRLYLALVDTVALLEIPVDVNGEYAEGNISNTKDGNFKLFFEDNRWQATIGDETAGLPSGAVVSHVGVIYVAQEVLESWLPITLKTKLADSYLILETSRALPFEKSLARQSRIITPKDYISESEYPVLDYPYAFLETPSAAVRVNHNVSRNTERDDETRRSTRYTLIGNGDLALMNTNLFVNGDRENGISNVSVRFDRYSSERDILGRLRLSQLSFGDVSVPGVDNSFGRGFVVSNESTAGQFVRDVTTIEGNYYPGWEVELYLGKTVVDYQIIGEDGKYRFDDVILSQGVNDYRLVFYGPAGEREEETRTLYQGDDSSEIGKLRYSFGINQPDTRLYEPSGAGDTDTWQANWIGRVSLTENIAINGGYTRRWIDEEELSDERRLSGDNADDIYQVGAATFWGGHSFSVSLRQENENPYSLSYGLGGDFRLVDYRLRYQDFRPEDETIANRLDRIYGLSLTTRLGGLGAVLDIQKSQFTDRERDTGEFYISGAGRGFNWSKGFQYEREKIGDEIQEDALGELFVGSGIGPLNSRLNMAYSITPDTRLVSMGLNNSLKLNSSVDVNLNYSRSLESDVDTYIMGMKWDLDYLSLNPTIRFSDNGFVSGNLNLLMFIGSRTGSLGDYYTVDRRSISSRGVVRARLFEDENNNGRYDQGERLLQGGIIHSLQTRQKAVADDVGVATLTNVRAWFPSDIVYENDTVVDYSMKYGGADFAIEARPGKILEIDMPFYRAGDIDGTVFRKYRDLKTVTARGITVELVNSEGKIIATTATASDGFYSFQKVLPGRYRVNVRGERLLSKTQKEVVITTQGNFVGGLNLVIAARGPDINGSANDLDFLSQTNNSQLKNVAFNNSQPKVKPVPQTVKRAEQARTEPVNSPAVSPQESPTRAAPVSAPNSAPATVDPWALQLGSFSVPSYANAMAERLQDESIPFYTREVNSSRGTFIKVFAGPFNDRNIALANKPRLDQTLQVQSFLVDLP